MDNNEGVPGIPWLVREVSAGISKVCKRLHLWPQKNGMHIVSFVMKDTPSRDQDGAHLQLMLAEIMDGRDMEMIVTRRGLTADVVIKERTQDNPVGFTIQSMPIDSENVDHFLSLCPDPAGAVVGMTADEPGVPVRPVLLMSSRKRTIVQLLWIRSTDTGPSGVVMN